MFVDSDSRENFVCEPVIMSLERDFDRRFQEYANLYSGALIDECDSQNTSRSNITTKSAERRKRADRTK